MYHCHNGKCSEMLDYTCERRCKVSYECGRKVLKLLKFLCHQFEDKIIRINKFYFLIQTINIAFSSTKEIQKACMQRYFLGLLL